MSTRARATSLSAVRTGGRRLSAVAAAVRSLASANRKGVIPGSAAGRFWWRDRARTQPWDPAVDLERTVEFADDLTGNPVGWQLGAALNDNNTFNAGDTGWLVTNASVSATLHVPGFFTQIAGGCRITNTTGGTIDLRFRPTLHITTPGRYRVTWKITKAPSAAITLGTAPNAGATSMSQAASGLTTGVATYDHTLTSGSVGFVMRIAAMPAGEYIELSSFTVQEVIRDESWLGANLVTNGTFAAGSASWAVAGNWTIGSGVATHTPSAGTENLDQSIALIAGKAYQIKFSLTRTAGTLIPMFVGGTAVIGPSYTASGEYELVLAATAGNNVIRMQASAAFDGSVDNITVREIPGNPIVSAVSGSGLVGSKRVNLLQRTEQIGAAPWSNAGAALVITQNAGAAPNGSNDAALLVPTTASAQHRVDQTPTSVAGAQVLTVCAKAAGYNFVSLRIGTTGAAFNLSDGTFVATGSPPMSTSSVPIGNGWYRCSITVAAVANDIARINVSQTANVVDSTAGDGTSGILVWGADLRYSFWNSFNLPAYQRVGDGTAGVFDYDDAGFPLHLKNVTGTQAAMTLGTVDMSAGDAGVMLANVVKLSDSGATIPAGTSADPLTASGNMCFFAPSSGGVGNYAARHGGTSAAAVSLASTYPAPHVAALVLQGDISSRLLSLSINGAVVGTDNVSTQGTGNLGNHRLNIAGRDVGGTASLRFTGYFIGNLPALVAGDAGIDTLALSRELAAQGGFTY